MLISRLSLPEDGSSFLGWMFLTKSAAELMRVTTSLEMVIFEINKRGHGND